MSEGASFCPSCGQARNAGAPLPAAQAKMSCGIAVPAALRGSFILHPQESVWHVWYADRYIPGPQGQSSNESGYLILTDQRMVFLRMQGMLSKTYNTTLTLPFEHVHGASAKEGLTLNKSLTVSAEQPGGIRDIVFRHLSLVDPISLKSTAPLAPSSAQRIINALVQNRLYAVAEERRRERIQYVLDFSFLKAEMEKGGVVVQTIKCPACGAGLELPSAGSSTRCTYCGNPVLAQDVFNKMKGIIGTL